MTKRLQLKVFYCKHNFLIQFHSINSIKRQKNIQINNKLTIYKASKNSEKQITELSFLV